MVRVELPKFNSGEIDDQNEKCHYIQSIFDGHAISIWSYKSNPDQMDN
jgi:hypothetical protein